MSGTSGHSSDRACPDKRALFVRLTEIEDEIERLEGDFWLTRENRSDRQRVLRQLRQKRASCVSVLLE